MFPGKWEEGGEDSYVGGQMLSPVPNFIEAEPTVFMRWLTELFLQEYSPSSLVWVIEDVGLDERNAIGDGISTATLYPINSLSAPAPL